MKKEFKHKKTGRIAKQHETMWYSVDGYTQSAPAWIIEDPDGDWQEITKDYEILKYDKYFFPDGERNIHTVMRLSDGEIVSVGQIRQSIFEKGTVDKIEEDDGRIYIYLDGAGVGIDNILKFRHPSFVSENGVWLFEGDKAFRINTCHGNMRIYEIEIDKHSVIGSHLKYFSTLEAAEEYRLWNYGRLSLKDISGYLDHDCMLAIIEIVKKKITFGPPIK